MKVIYNKFFIKNVWPKCVEVRGNVKLLNINQFVLNTTTMQWYKIVELCDEFIQLVHISFDVPEYSKYIFNVGDMLLVPKC